jgi:hypothetical protein
MPGQAGGQRDEANQQAQYLFRKVVLTLHCMRFLFTDILPIKRSHSMSFQAYLDNIEEKTGKTPNEFIAMAKEKGFDNPKTKAGDIVAWLKEDYGLGRGHAMAIVYIIKNGAEIGDKHVGSDGVHRDESTVLKLDGKKKE